MNELKLPCLYSGNKESTKDSSRSLLESVLEAVLDAKDLETLNGKNLVISEEDLCDIVGCTLHGAPSLSAKQGIKELSTILIEKEKELLDTSGKVVAVSYKLRDFATKPIPYMFSGLITIEGLDDAKKAEVLELYRKLIVDSYRSLFKAE